MRFKYDIYILLVTFPWLSLARVNLKPLSPQPLTTTRPLLLKMTCIVAGVDLCLDEIATSKTAQGVKEEWWRGPRCFLTPHFLCCPSLMTPILLQIKMKQGRSPRTMRIWLGYKCIHSYSICAMHMFFTCYLTFVAGICFILLSKHVGGGESTRQKSSGAVHHNLSQGAHLPRLFTSLLSQFSCVFK